jgi:hypothetical protein
MKEKIERINKLNTLIKDLSAFLEILAQSNKPSKYRNGDFNRFLNLEVASSIWTGDDTVRVFRNITDENLLNDLSEMMKVVISNKIEQYKLELESLIK